MNSINCRGCDRPLERDLNNHVIPEVADKWREIGVELLDTDSTKELDIINSNHQNDTKVCCREMFKKWLDSEEHASWDQLLRALRSKSVKLNVLANKIENMLIGNASPSGSSISFSECDVIQGFMLLESELSRILKSADFCTLQRALKSRLKRHPEPLKMKIKEANELNTLLDALADSKYWNFADLRIINVLVHSSGIREAKDLLDNYRRAFFSKTLSDVLRTCIPKEVLPPNQHKDYVCRVSSKIPEEPDEITIADLAQYCTRLETVIMDIHEGCCALERIQQKACIKIHWLIPIRYSYHAYKSAFNNRHKFHSLHLQYLEIESYPVIYDQFTVQPTVLSTLLCLPNPIVSTPAEVIDHYYCFLADSLSNDSFCQIMSSLNLLREDDKTTLSLLPSEYQGNTSLLDHLLVSDATSICRFCHILRDTENQQEIGYILVNAIQSLPTDNDTGKSLQSESGSFQQASTTDFDKDEEISELTSEMILAAKSVHMKFLNMTIQVNKILQKCDSQVFLEACNKLYACISQSKAEPLFPSNYITNLDTVEDILKRLSFLWSWHNFSVLRTLLEACNCQDGLTLLEEFGSQIDLNQAIELFPIPRLSSKMAPFSSSAYTILSIRRKPYQDQQTPLQYTKEIATILGKAFGISQHALQLLAVQPAPLIIYWMIPKSIVSLISKEIYQHTNTLRDSQFLEITAYPNITFFPKANLSFSLLNCDHPQEREWSIKSAALTDVESKDELKRIEKFRSRMKELTTVHSDEEIVASLQLKPHFKSQEMDTEIKMLYASKRDLSDNQKDQERKEKEVLAKDHEKREGKPLTTDQERKEKELLPKDQEKREEKPLTADQERKAFQIAMQDGVANSLSFRVCVFGPENSGKTCLVDTLFDDIFQQQAATQGADIHIHTTYATNWQKCTLEQMADNIQTQFFHGLNEQVKSPSFRAISAARKPGFVSKFKAVLFRSNPSSSSQLHKAPEVKLEESKQAKASKIVSEKEFTGIIWDFAGQIQYLSTHTVFVRRDNVVFIVFKASCHLSDLIKARPGDEDSASGSKPTTYFHIIHYWLQTITSVCHDTSGADHMSEFLPTAVLIATHIDEIIGDLEQAKEAIITQLAKELEGKPYTKHLAGNLPGVGLLNALRKFCIFLSNKVRDESIITQLKEIVLQISAPSMKEKHPLIYLKIEKELLLLRKEVISTTEFHKIAVENGFMAKENSMKMKGALDHFHQKGVILHFPSIDGLKRLVFLSPQWLEKLIAFLIIAHHYKPMGDKDDHSYRRLKHEGVLVGSFLDHSLQMFNKLHRVIGCEIAFDQAVAFLSNFGFVAEISITAEFLEESHPWSDEETRIFIVPSQLPEGKEKRKLSFVKEKVVWSIYFAFIDGFIPLTIFHQMIAVCINWNESRNQSIAWLQKYQILMVLNHGQFYSVSLCEEKSSIQVDIILGKSMKKSAENRKQLIDFFQTTLENICNDLIPGSSKPIPYIQCPHCDKVHLKLRNLLEARSLLCNMIPVHQDYYQDLFREFQVSNKMNEAEAEQSNEPEYSKNEKITLESMISQNVPTVKQLMYKVIPQVAADWKQLAFKLEFDISRVDIIKQKGRDDPESCCYELLCEWLSTDHGIKPKNWTTLLTTLKQIKKLTSVTDEIEKDLQTQLTILQNKPGDNITSSLTHSSKVLSQVPKMHHMMRVVVPKITGHWKEVAFNLHYDVTRVRIIQEKCRDDPERCTCELFMYWLHSSEGLGPRSWETLLSVLKETPKLTAVKESIERELIELLTSND